MAFIVFLLAIFRPFL
jgi:hypothetical protein